jgi:cobalt-zinc-cadmium efflux system outer membrane protein
MALLHDLRSNEKPIDGRCCWVLFFALLFEHGASAAEPDARPVTLTEEAVVARSVNREPLADVVQGQVALETARGRAAGAYPNPVLAYVREQTFGELGTGEDYLSIAQVIDLGGRRALAAEAWEIRSQAAESAGATARQEIAADARQRFYDVLHRRERVSVLEAWSARIEEAVAILLRREERGDVSPFERRRLERERGVAAGRLSAERAFLESALARLGGILGEDLSDLDVRIDGSLLPEGELASLPELAAKSQARPDLVALGLQADASAIEETVASRWWAPDLRLEAGWKGVDLGALGRSDGFFVGASLALPLWDQGSGASDVAAAEARVSRGRRALRGSELEGELGGLRAEAERLGGAAAALREQALAASIDLLRIAAAGYEGGELGVLELLDANRGATDDALAVLDLELDARRARIELERRTGGELP